MIKKREMIFFLGVSLLVFGVIGCQLPANAGEMLAIPSSSDAEGVPTEEVALAAIVTPEGENNQVEAPIATVTPDEYVAEGSAEAAEEVPTSAPDIDPTPMPTLQPTADSAEVAPTEAPESNETEAQDPTPTATATPMATPTAVEIAPPTPTATPTEPIVVGDQPENDLIHVVQPGENLYRIGLQYGYSWVVLAQINNLPNGNFVQDGQELLIPGTAPAAPPSPSPTPTATATPTATPEGGGNAVEGEAGDEAEETSEPILHTVQQGQNLFRIGLIYGLDWRLIAEANGIINPTELKVGQVIKIPSDQPGDLPEIVHTVQTGETLSLLAVMYGLSIETIAERNEITAPFVILVGDTLIIPSR